MKWIQVRVSDEMGKVIAHEAVERGVRVSELVRGLLGREFGDFGGGEGSANKSERKSVNASGVVGRTGGSISSTGEPPGEET